LCLFQVFILNNIQLSGFVNPYFYVLFILLLPFEIPGWLLLSLGFVLGLTIDVFSNTPGSACFSNRFYGISQALVLDYFAPRDGYEPGTFPRIYYYGSDGFFNIRQFSYLHTIFSVLY
jgi:rod shape-determining protein MreD